MTKIVTYLRNSTTQYDMKIRMKSESAKKAFLPRCSNGRRPYRHRIMGSLETPGFFVVVLEANTFIKSILFYKTNSRFFISLPFIFEFSLW